MSSLDQQYYQSTPGPNSYHLPGQHSCLLEHTTGTYQTCEEYSMMPTRGRAQAQPEEMRVQQTGS